MLDEVAGRLAVIGKESAESRRNLWWGCGAAVQPLGGAFVDDHHGNLQRRGKLVSLNGLYGTIPGSGGARVIGVVAGECRASRVIGRCAAGPDDQGDDIIGDRAELSLANGRLEPSAG